MRSGGIGRAAAKTVRSASEADRPLRIHSRYRQSSGSGRRVLVVFSAQSRYEFPVTRLVVVSNRLPIRVAAVDGRARIEASTGGLATGLRTPHESGDGVWIGWPGDLSALSEEERSHLESQLIEQRLVPVDLDSDLVKRYYESFANGVLWPLFHYVVAALPLEVRDFDAYSDANQRFAEAVASVARPGDRVWVHDYQLLLLPEMVRRLVPGVRIGFFLHIPFPSSEVFRALPHREELLRGMLGADLVAFHTPAYVRHFASTLLRILGVSTEIDRVAWEGREVRLGVHPMGIDARAFAATADDPSVQREALSLRGDAGEQILLGVDRLDYTKGIPRRLLAFERLLERHPELRERVRFVQVAVPSRAEVPAYQDFRSQADQLIGRIHGAFATARWVPVHWIYRGLSREDVVALYRSADVMLVTPIRDGMNLVAKEFVASRTDGDGVLVLSEFAGAAAELAEALLVNPYDVAAMADTYYRALTMPEAERRARMAALRRRVFLYDVHRWVAASIDTLEVGEHSEPGRTTLTTSHETLAELAHAVAAAPYLLLLLDYDGTLMPIQRTPELAQPDRELLELLGSLASRPRTDVHVVSGRAHEILDVWLAGLPIGLHAEHGLWSRAADGKWICDGPFAEGWREPVLAILEEFAARTPGSLVERKTASLAWHYRAADPEYGEFQAKDLRLHLTELLSNQPVELLSGDKVIELRPHGVNKGRIVGPLLPGLPPGARILAMGDDTTDEDLFAALPEGSASIRVGLAPSRAAFRIGSVREARAFLRSLLEVVPEPAG